MTTPNTADAQEDFEFDALIVGLARARYDVAVFGSSFRAYPPAVTGGAGIAISPDKFCGACGEPLSGDLAEVCWVEGIELVPGLNTDDILPMDSFVIHSPCYDPQLMVIA